MAKRLGRNNPEPPPAPEAHDDAGLTDDDLGLSDGVAAEQLPKIRRRPAALFQFHPESWQVLNGEVVPLFGSLQLTRGIANVQKGKNPGTVSIALAEAERKKRGWVTIPHNIDGRSYLQPVRTADGGKAFLTRWETAHAGSSLITSDVPAFVAWCRKLMADGKIPRPAPYVLERMAARLREEVRYFEDQVRTVPSAQLQLDRVRKNLAAVERELASVKLNPVVANAGSVDDLIDAGTDSEE